MKPRYLNARSAAEYLDLSLPALYTLVHRGRIPVQRIGRRLRFDVEQLDIWIQEAGNGHRGQLSARIPADGGRSPRNGIRADLGEQS